MTIWGAVMNASIGFVFVLLLLSLGIILFSYLTPYSTFQLMKEGSNLNHPHKVAQAKAVAYELSGKMVGIGIILFCSIFNMHSLKKMVFWGLLGIFLELIIYYLFILCAPMKVASEIEKGNIAIAHLSSQICVASGLLIGSFASLS
ncbi:DUF350 domain-containing protein [Thermoflavimicrobium daqui]|jgi:putative membrane protein|nr:DUF350 domain-containing protein [Thermoflavimicrobium daqui]